MQDVQEDTVPNGEAQAADDNSRATDAAGSDEAEPAVAESPTVEQSAEEDANKALETMTPERFQEWKTMCQVTSKTCFLSLHASRCCMF